ncbi:MAG: HD domain-containing protein, partial [Firmicutes bacterium]|nr:HD domain-containing protein [Bacillota bacterium]
MIVSEIQKALKVLSSFPNAFFVGGGLRNLLIGRVLHDMDLVVEGAEKAALAIADNVKGTLVKWGDKDRGVCFRFVFSFKNTMDAEGRTGGNTSRQAWLDITELEGDIVVDLGRRDFTVNALAVPLEEILPILAHNQPARECVEEMVIDPFGGLADLKKGILREVAGSIFLDDPLRLWRVWRFSAQLGFLPTKSLKLLVSRNAHLCRKVAGERTRAEVFCLLAQPDAGTWLLEAGKYGLVENQFPQMIPMIDCIQGGYHHQDVWEHSFQVVLELDNLIKRANDFFSDDAALLDDWLSRGNNLPVLKLAALLHDIGKPLVREVDDKNRVRFFGHERAGLGLT